MTGWEVTKTESSRRTPRGPAGWRASRGVGRRAWGIAMQHRCWLFAFLALAIADALVTAAFPLIYRAVIDDGIVMHRADIVVELALLMAVLAVADGGLILWQRWISVRFGSKLVLELRSRLFNHLQRMPLAFFTHAKTGAVVSRLNNDVLGVQRVFTDTLSTVVSNSITVVVTVVAMLVLSWPIAVLSLLSLPVFLACSRLVSQRLVAVTREYYSCTAEMNVTLTERFNVAGATLMMLFGRPGDDAAAFREAAGRVGRLTVTQAMYARILATSLLLTGALSTALAYGWGGVLAVQGSLRLGTVIALTAYLVRLYAPFSALSAAQLDMVGARVSFDRVFELLDFQPVITQALDAVTIPRGVATIEFDHVDFRYPPAAQAAPSSLADAAEYDQGSANQVLLDICFRAGPGQVIAIVGPSGAGKTTIGKLVPRLYDAAAGTLSVNGVDVRLATHESLQAAVGLVTQDAHLFHASIRANLLYAKPDATDAQLAEALGAAQLLAFVESLPDGLDTTVGEHGLRLSGGQRQRFAVARLLLKAPDIVVLDEATAHLDMESERALQQALSIALRGRTALVIAHRLATIRDADLILVMSRGRIVERGTHAELLNADGQYAKMHRLQAVSGTGDLADSPAISPAHEAAPSRASSAAMPAPEPVSAGGSRDDSMWKEPRAYEFARHADKQPS